MNKTNICPQLVYSPLFVPLLLSQSSPYINRSQSWLSHSFSPIKDDRSDRFAPERFMVLFHYNFFFFNITSAYFCFLALMHDNLSYLFNFFYMISINQIFIGVYSTLTSLCRFLAALLSNSDVLQAESKISNRTTSWYFTDLIDMWVESGIH